jgi:hypothetical protein
MGSLFSSTPTTYSILFSLFSKSTPERKASHLGNLQLQRIRLMERCNVPDKYCRFRRSTHYNDTSVTLEILRPAAAWVSVLVKVSHDLLGRQA